MQDLPLPYAIALIITSSGCCFFMTKWILAARQAAQEELNSRFDRIYSFIDGEFERARLLTKDDVDALWKSIGILQERTSHKNSKSK